MKTAQQNNAPLIGEYKFTPNVNIEVERRKKTDVGNCEICFGGKDREIYEITFIGKTLVICHKCAVELRKKLREKMR